MNSRTKVELYAELEVIVQRITRGFTEPEGLNELYLRVNLIKANILSLSLGTKS